MEWLIGGYLVVGIFKTFGRLVNPNPALKPSWMTIERNPLKRAFAFTVHVMLWPFANR